jgi:anti-anti-sigma factor
MDSVTPLSLDVTDAGGARRVTAVGELDLTTAPVLQECLLRELEAGSEVELDLAGVPFADSSALRVLVTVDRRAEELGVRFVMLAPLPAQMRRVFEVTGLMQRLPIVPAVTGNHD